MFLCKDISQRYLLAVYWEQGALLLAIKELMPDRNLVEHVSVAYGRHDARRLMEDLIDGDADLHGVEVDTLTATAIAGRVAEGLRTAPKKHSISRIRPEHWQ